MRLPSIVVSHTGIELRPAPIEPSWVLEGAPVARNGEISRSPDGTSCTLVWECAPGKFMWRYDTEETIHILEGRVVLNDGNGPERQLGPGDVVFFPAGAKVHWHVVEHVRKLAFFRRQFPKPVEVVVRSLRVAKHLLKGRKAPTRGFMNEPMAVDSALQ